jgi:hypothetical protein
MISPLATEFKRLDERDLLLAEDQSGSGRGKSKEPQRLKLKRSAYVGLLH